MKVPAKRNPARLGAAACGCVGCYAKQPGRLPTASNPIFEPSSTAWQAKKGKKRALIAVAHSVLMVAYLLRKRGCVYEDLGGDYFERINQDQLTRYHTKKLIKL